MNIQPLGARVLVEPVAAETETKSGIIIPDTAQEKPLQAKVLAIGSDVKDIEIGSTVLYGNYTGITFDYENKTYLMLENSDIIAKL